MQGIFRWRVTRNGNEVRRSFFKAMAVMYAAKVCHQELTDYGMFSELIIKNLNGQISKDKRTYGDDPPNVKG